VDVEPDGAARNIKVLRSIDPGLDQKAIEAVSQWKFKPGTKDGVAVTVRAQIQVNFRLIKDPAKQPDAN
jgi:TonB family protein